MLPCSRFLRHYRWHVRFFLGRVYYDIKHLGNFHGSDLQSLRRAGQPAAAKQFNMTNDLFALSSQREHKISVVYVSSRKLASLIIGVFFVYRKSYIEGNAIIVI